jgi:L-2-hydroxyglutarate oxidase LhgO
MHALIENGTVAQYPYTTGDLKRANPDTSFPSQISDASLLEYGVHRVFFATQPEVTATQVLEEGTPVFSTEDQRWTQTFTVRDMSAEEIAEYSQGIQRQIIDATQQRLDDFAATRHYSGIMSAATYATSSVPQFKSDGQYCVNARDATWAKLYEMLVEVQAGTRPMPNGYADVEPELPVLEWP